MRFSRRDRRDDVRLELTPLIDVMFLLLIFFLVTASFTRDPTQAIPLDLPGGESGSESTEDARVVVLVQSGGIVSLSLPTDETPRQVPDGELLAELNALDPAWRNVPVHLRGDVNVNYGRVIRVLDEIRTAGFLRVFNVIQSGAGSAEP